MNDLDRLTEAYLAALDAGDFPALERMWEDAAFDPELERALFEIEAAIDADNAEREERAAARTVGAAVETHLKSAVILRPDGGPITVGDVARELFRHTPDGLAAESHAFNADLQSSSEPLPDNLGLSKLTAWLEQRFGSIPAEYRPVFQRAALKLERRRASSVEYQLAARRGNKPEEPK